MVVMAFQMMHHTHNNEPKTENNNKRKKETKNIKWNGEMEGKWNEKTYGGG